MFPIVMLDYVTNDLDTDMETDYHMEALDFLKMYDDTSVSVVLYDPPYSLRQVSEVYKKLGKTVTMRDTSAAYFADFKKEISRVLNPGGIVITCYWNTNWIGMKYGCDIIEVLAVAHGGSHNDTLVTVERRR